MNRLVLSLLVASIFSASFAQEIPLERHSRDLIGFNRLSNNVHNRYVVDSISAPTIQFLEKMIKKGKITNENKMNLLRKLNLKTTGKRRFGKRRGLFKRSFKK